jgi:hypothetical protein
MLWLYLDAWIEKFLPVLLFRNQTFEITKGKIENDPEFGLMVSSIIDELECSNDIHE